jgi:uncharacterized protein YggE
VNRNAAALDEGLMMKKRLAVLAMVLLPVAASAQGPPIPRSPNAGGIIVQGYGSVRIPVKSVQLIAQVRGVVDETSALAALRAAGVEDPAMGPNGPRIGSGTQLLVRGTIHGVTRAKLDRVGEAAVAYMAAHPGTTVDNVAFSPRLDDCAPAEQTARAAAFADARRKADAIAALAGVSIDGVATVSESGGCPATTDSGYGGQGQFDLGTLTSTIVVNEYVTFAISPGTASTRRRTL